MHPHPDRVAADRPDRVLELDAPAIDLMALGRQRRRDVLRGDRAEQLAFLARLAAERQRNAAQLGRGPLRLGPLGLVADAARPGLRRDPLLVTLGGLVGEAVGQEIVARVAWLDPHHLAGLAERPHVLAQDHFHHRLNPPVDGVDSRRRKSSQVSASPSRVSPPRTNGSKNTAMKPSTAPTGPATPPAWVRTTASPRAAYSTTSTRSRFAPAM